jgi:chemotaxis response regulator CheB
MKAKKSETGKENFDYDLGKTILNFPVVGIGASAGGLEALQDFFKNCGYSAPFSRLQELHERTSFALHDDKN